MENKRYLNADDVAQYMEISVPMAYKIIRKLNNELLAQGYLVVAGRVSRRYFEQKVYGGTCAQGGGVMSAYKDAKKNTWYAKFRYKDWMDDTKWVTKRGFSTKREALQWERDFLAQKSGSTEMIFRDFVAVYLKDRTPRLKESTTAMKENVIETQLVPYFGKLPLRDITSKEVIQWQNEMLNHRDEKGKPYSPVYLKTLHNQLSAVFNHAVRHYNLKVNPAAQVGNMGKAKGREMLFWTKAEYLKFAEAMMDKPLSYYAFEMLYWCGVREGELLALTPADFDFEKQTVTISKSYREKKEKPLLAKIVKVLRSLYLAYVELQEKFNRLQGNYDHVCGENTSLRNKVTELWLENKKLRQISADYHGSNGFLARSR